MPGVCLLVALVCVGSLGPGAAMAARVSPGEGELEDVAVVPLDASLEPEAVLRARPFVIGASPCPIFCPQEGGSPVSERAARRALAAFLERRGLEEGAILAALAEFDDPDVVDVVPAPTLRAALLMLWEWAPYDAALAAVFAGENPTGHPFAAIDFADLGVDGAVATLVGTSEGRQAILVDDAYAAEPPAALINVLVHESLHDTWQNSQEEEIIANILDNVLYAELLLVDPSLAQAGTLLTTFNNFALLALLNSTVRAGPDRLGITATPFDDVWLGDRLDEINADSLRDAIAGDGFYAELPSGGSSGLETFWALIERFPAADELGPTPDFDESALAVIDRGVGRIIDPGDAVELAAVLELNIVAGVTEVAAVAPLPDDPALALAVRPFAATDAALLDPAAAAPTAPLDESEARVALDAILVRQDVPASLRDDLRYRFDDPTLADHIPDPTLRAAALLLAVREPWDQALAAIVGDGDTPGPLPVAFASLPFGTLVARGRTSDDGVYSLLVSEDLAGESPEVLASLLVEGLLLHERKADGRTTRDQAVLANLLGALAYADFLIADPDLATRGTAGVIARNRDVFAILNSAAWQTPPIDDLANAERANLGALGFLGAPAGVDDILPGLYADATSFADFVTSQPRADDYSRRTRLIAPSIVASFLAYVGVDLADLDGSVDGVPSFGDASSALDARLGAFVPPEEALDLARALRLGVTSRES